MIDVIVVPVGPILGYQDIFQCVGHMVAWAHRQFCIAWVCL